MNAPVGHEQNAQQSAYWNGRGGERWRDRQEVQDAQFAPITDLLIARAAPRAGERVLDVGCGCGAITLAFAQRVGAGGHVTGVDISVPMLGRARERAPSAAPVEFILADATTHAFPPAWFDLAVSRFGVMFFADPTAAFANLRTGLCRGGRVVFVCWRAPDDNPWLTVPLAATYEHAPPLPETGPDDPGLFSFSSQERVECILGDAGYTSIGLERHDFTLDIAAGRGLDEAVRAALAIGATAHALEGQPPQTRAAAADAIHVALTPHVAGDTVPLGASIWIVTALNP